MLNNKLVYKSKIIFKNLNPLWNESFKITLSPKALISDMSGVLTNESLNDINSFSTLSEISTTTSQLEYFISKFKLKALVYDYDRGFLSDDLIGYQSIDITNLKENM